MSNLQSFYTKFLDLLEKIEPSDNFLNQIRIPKLSDKELLSLALASEACGIDSENHLFKQLPQHLKGRIERSVYNRRRRRLTPKLEMLRNRVSEQIIPSEQYHLIDSMPLETCKISRAKRTTACNMDEQTAPDYGFCAAQNMHYFGYKLHAVCTVQGVIKMFDISKASCHDIHYLNDVKSQLNHCVLIGDKGYLSRAVQADLFDTSAIELATPKRANQPGARLYPKEFRRARKRIETLFSQLCDQFMIRRNYAKQFQGFAARISAKITAFTFIQWLNVQSGNKINNIKIAFS